MSIEYFATTAGRLDHYFRTCIGAAHVLMDFGQTGINYNEMQERFISGLERVIAKNLPEYDGVTNDHLREMVELARGKDWSDREQLLQLRARYREIRHRGE
ncbi:MAG: hypothetical protein HZB67_03750 [Candidatus Aenigmarchaeota archaeon]|nr:hypothetical protein [Candidatus Aenigmarchaeota archaeon]